MAADFENYPAPEGWHEHGPMCDCYRCDEDQAGASGEVGWGEDDF